MENLDGFLKKINRDAITADRLEENLSAVALKTWQLSR